MRIHHRLKHLLFCALFFASQQLFAQPVNNTCASATVLTPSATCGAVTGQSLFNATSDGLGATLFGATYDVWYKFTATSTNVQISLSATGGGITNTNTYIEAFNAINCAGISAASSLGAGTRQNGLTITGMTIGTVYYFRVFSTVNPNSSAGNWALASVLQKQ